MKAMQKKIYIFIIGVSIAVILGLIIQYSYLNEIITNDKRLNMNHSREHLADEINNNIKYHSQPTIIASRFIASSQWTEEETMEYLNMLIRDNQGIKSIYFGDVNNNLIISNNWIPPSFYDLRRRQWYTRPIEEKALAISDVYIDAVDNNLVVSISQPIYDKNNMLMGVVGADMSIEKIVEMVEDTTIKGLGYSFLIDSVGHILAHPEYRYGSGSELIYIDSISEGIYEELISFREGLLEVKLNGVEGYLSYEPMENTDWIIANFMSLEEFKGSGQDIWRIFLIAFTMVMIIFGLFAYLQRRYLVLPLIRLDKDFRKVDLGNDIDYRMPMDEGDYFFDLRRTINRSLTKTQELFEENQLNTEEIVAQHDELEASYHQLSAMDEELRDQYEKLVESEEKLRYLSYYDQLTGLYNRRYFEEQLNRLDNLRSLPLTLIMSDVNGLKLINDSFGHKAGDELLQIAAHVIKDSCRSSDIVARIGGDEFIIILPNADEEEAEVLISRIKNRIKNKKISNIELSVSFGFATKTEEDMDIGEILIQAEDDMYSKKLYEGQSMRSKAIDTIIKSLYEKSKEEEEHSKRVALICQDIGIALEMSEREIKELETVGLLHDIGKIGVDDKIFEKSESLTEEEWEEMKRHPEIGYRILNTVHEMSKIAEYTLAHHERYDGLGYPKGLKGEDIPLISRIINIADSYDAMINDRPYGKGLSNEDAVTELIQGAGRQFDPKLARVFVEKVLRAKWIEG